MVLLQYVALNDALKFINFELSFPLVMQFLYVFDDTHVFRQLGRHSVADLLQQRDPERQRRVREEAGPDPGGHGQGEGERGETVNIGLSKRYNFQQISKINQHMSKTVL